MAAPRRMTPMRMLNIAGTVGRLVGDTETLVGEFDSADEVKAALESGRWPVAESIMDTTDPAEWRQYLARVCRRAAELLEGG